METRGHHVLAAFFRLLEKVTLSVSCHSSKSSICACFARHSSAFSGLFQAS